MPAAVTSNNENRVVYTTEKSKKCQVHSYEKGFVKRKLLNKNSENQQGHFLYVAPLKKMWATPDAQ
ncbi:hypothetical protein KIN20_026185 [Parelaphostrongylus tenuis]|uniref:Uncharacterized protein n=1 Tax=Parelaphostrongylus tenuis TaxID=148309 RepID=A0AAD5QUX6_PARTN|nr:hypothetical protein KIN20_026185 [Parelaphostrongylus tenuis]